MWPHAEFPTDRRRRACHGSRVLVISAQRDLKLKSTRVGSPESYMDQSIRRANKRHWLPREFSGWTSSRGFHRSGRSASGPALQPR